MIETNIKRVRKSVSDAQGRYALRTRDLTRKISRAGRDNVRANISRAGGFPGYAISGALAKKVVAGQPQPLGNGWTATIQVKQTGRQKKYALIHEVGGVIRAKNAPYLVFRIPGVGWRKVKQVTIRAKRYFRRGIDKTRREWSINRLRREF